MLRRYLFLATALTLLTSSSASATPVTLVFQHGSEVTRNAVGTGVTYAGTIDTVVLDNDNIDRGGDPSFGVDSSATSSTGNDQDSLLGFGDLFGATLDRIPAGSTITSATLHLVQNSGFGEGGVANARRMLVSWTEADTWQSLTTSGIGLQSNGVEVRTTDSFTIPGGIRFVRSEYDRDVMADIQFWSDNPTQNFGWALLPLGMGGTRGMDITSSEGATLADHPRLSVTFDFVAEAEPAPEPSTFVLAAVGLAGLGLVAWRRRRRQQ